MADFATVNDVIAISGINYTSAEQERISTLLPLICDTLRLEANKVGKDLAVMAEDASYASVLKLVTCDVVIRAMRQTQSGDPLSQESQSANGYSWSGTYAIPGGGIASSIMNNDLKRLGLRRQKYGVIDFYYEEQNAEN